MFTVVFEVQPKPEVKEEYLALALGLRPLLEATEGFVEVERFESRRRPGWILSLSSWRDEKSVIRWRCQRDHHRIQGRGRYELFADYRLRVCEVTTDTGLPAGTTLVQQRFDETEVGDAKALGITELPPTYGAGTHQLAPEAEGLTAHDLFESIYNPGKMLLLTSWSTAGCAAAWAPGSDASGLRHRRVRVIRDYGLADRFEAPQYYPPVSERLGARLAPPPEP